MLRDRPGQRGSLLHLSHASPARSSGVAPLRYNRSMGDTTWRLKAVEGSGWVEHVYPDGQVAITALPRQAKQYPTVDAAETARERIRRGVVPLRAVAGPAFSSRLHGEPR